MKGKFDKKHKVRVSLLIIFLLAVSLRCLMPAYLLVKQNKPLRYMQISSYAWDMISMSISIAKGEGINLEYLNYAEKFTGIITPSLDKIEKGTHPRPFWFADKGGLPQIFIASLITRTLNSFNVPVIQIFQGIIDSLGCFLVFGILSFFFSYRICRLGALFYAISPVFIFYSYHFMSEAYIPVLMLAIGYTIIKALHRGKWQWFALAGFLIGLSLSFRSDNILILPFYMGFVIWFYRRRLSRALMMAVVLSIFAIFAYMPFQMAFPKSSEKVSTIGVALYNSLGEYPANYKGKRFFDDNSTIKYAPEKANTYLEKNDQIFKLMYDASQSSLFFGMFKPITKYDLTTLAYVREIIISKPLLYANWLVSRFFAYLPSHPFLASTAYFFNSLELPMREYRHSALFNFVKYIDYFCFLVFVYGVWLARRNSKLLSLLCIYFGVLVTHVIVGCGEVYFRNDLEYAYLDPRYLLGMISLSPVFLAIAFGRTEAKATEKDNN